MKKLILILGILAIIFLAGCAIEQVEDIPDGTFAEPAGVEDVATEAEKPAEETESVEEPAEEVEEEPAVEEEPVIVPEPAEEAPKSDEIVEFEIKIKTEITNYTIKKEARLERISVDVKNTKYEQTLRHPRKDLRLKVYTTNDLGDEIKIWINDIIEHEKIKYGMVVTKSSDMGGYIFKEEAIINAEVYDSKDILLANASKTVTRQ